MELPYIFYNDLLEEIVLKLQYMAVVNLLARDYSDEKIFDMVHNMNPINIDHIEERGKEKKDNREKVTLSKLKEVGLI